MNKNKPLWLRPAEGVTHEEPSKDVKILFLALSTAGICRALQILIRRLGGQRQKGQKGGKVTCGDEMCQDHLGVKHVIQSGQARKAIDLNNIQMLKCLYS